MVIFKKGFVFVTCRIYLLCSVCNSLVQILVQNLVENLKPVQINLAQCNVFFHAQMYHFTPSSFFKGLHF